MQPTVSQGKYHVVGGGIAGLAAAVFLVRDARVAGGSVHVYEQLGTAGGSLMGQGMQQTDI